MVPIAVHLNGVVVFLLQDVQLFDETIHTVGIGVVNERLCSLQEDPFAIVEELSVVDGPFGVVHGSVGVPKLRRCRDTEAKYQPK